MNVGYATQIARDWNTKDAQSQFVGYVLKFAVASEFLNQFSIHQVGDVSHREYWIPAADLPALNENIVGEIEIVAEYHANS